MKTVFKSLLAFAALFALNACTSSATRYSDNGGDWNEVKKAPKMAIISFQGNTIITGSTGVGSLVSGLLATAKESSSSGLTEDYFNKSYTLYFKAFQKAGYTLTPPEKVKAAPTYKKFPVVEMPSYKNAKGLKPVDWRKKDELKALAKELGVDHLVCIENGHSIYSKSNYGVVGGTSAGEANINIYIFDGNGDRIMFTTAAEESDKNARQVAGVQDASEILPMLEEADAKLANTLAKKLARP